MTALTCSSSTPSSADTGSAAAAAASSGFSAVHPDVLLTHILSRLDGPTLATASCASSSLYSLISSDDALWRAACAAVFPSTASHPRLRHLISCHRSFFRDAFPFLDKTRADLRHLPPSLPPPDLISAVDIHYAGYLVFSKVLETKTASSSSSWLKWAPFCLDALDRGESVVLPLKFSASDGGACMGQLEENLTVSWIVVDPALGRAANLSSRRAVSAKLRRRWTSSAARDVEVRYATVVAGGGPAAEELVECAVVVTCGGKEGGEVHVRELSVRLEDMDGRHLTGDESWAILGEAMQSGRRRRRKRIGDERERYEDYEEKRRERRERRERKERLVDMATMALGFSIFCAIWFLLLLR